MDDSMKRAIAVIFDGIDQLRASCNNRRKFTIDGRLVGDIGEIIADSVFDIELDPKSRADYDAKTRDGRNVQIKATFQDALTFKREPELYIGLKLYKEGRFDIVFNGPGRIIAQRFNSRAGLGEKLLRFPVKDLRLLSETSVAEDERVPLRNPSVLR